MRVLQIVGRIGEATPDASFAAVRPLALALGDHGVELQVFAAGSPAPDAPEGSPPDLAIERVQRLDRFPEHWQKGRSAAVAATLRATLEHFAPDLVHVHAWRSLSDDLVLGAARAGVPAVVSLHDHYVSCLLATRIDPTTGAPCERAFGPHPCVSCASGVPPRTPWVPVEEQYMALALRRECLLRELRLARKRLVPAGDSAAILTPLMPLLPGAPSPTFETEPAADAPRALTALYDEVVADGAPEPGELPSEEWFEERLRASAQDAWDRACAEHASGDLGRGWDR